MSFSWILALCEMQKASFRIWTWVAKSISLDDGHYAMSTSENWYVLMGTLNSMEIFKFVSLIWLNFSEQKGFKITIKCSNVLTSWFINFIGFKVKRITLKVFCFFLHLFTKFLSLKIAVLCYHNILSFLHLNILVQCLYFYYKINLNCADMHFSY